MAQAQPIKTKKHLHKFGASLSLLCAIHCLVTPLAITFLPMAGGSLFKNEAFEWAMITASAVLAAFLLSRDYWKTHKKALSLYIFGLGISILVGSHLTKTPHYIISSLGGLLIFIAFITNYLHTHSAHDCANH